MDLEQIRKYCLSLPHATERVQWGNDLLFCIGEKMFAVAGLDAKYPTKLSFKCTPEKFAELVEREGIIRRRTLRATTGSRSKTSTPSTRKNYETSSKTPTNWSTTNSPSKSARN